ncbi:MAG: hypothetical protein H8E17_04405 [Deltaproteobacteria bacterium]|nr:hypothetical protein [Deltaproteobacteria bacterium]
MRTGFSDDIKNLFIKQGKNDVGGELPICDLDHPCLEFLTGNRGFLETPWIIPEIYSRGDEKMRSKFKELLALREGFNPQIHGFNVG